MRVCTDGPESPSGEELEAETWWRKTVREGPFEAVGWQLRPDSTGLEELDDLLELSMASSQVESSQPSMVYLPIDYLGWDLKYLEARSPGLGEGESREFQEPLEPCRAIQGSRPSVPKAGSW